MKILNCFLDNRFGGPQRRACSVAGKLKKYNIETIFLFNEKSDGDIPIKGFKCFLIRHIQCITQKATVTNLFLFCLLSPYNFYKICKMIRKEKIDLVHTNGLINCLPALAAGFLQVKVLWHLNDTMHPKALKNFFLPIILFFSNKIAVAAKRVGFYYFGNKAKFWNKSSILYAPVDVMKFNPNSVDVQKAENLRIEFGILNNNFVVGAIGNINPAKGYEYFIEAAKQVKERVENVKFLIVGAKLDTQQKHWSKLQSLISLLGLEGDIIFTGFRKDIPEILSILHVFVLSSVTEACPITVLEAMAMKVPVIATNVGGVSEQIIHGVNGILVEARRPDLLAEGILKIINSSKEDLEKIVKAGRKRAEEIFSLDIIAKKHKDVYDEILLN